MRSSKSTPCSFSDIHMVKSSRLCNPYDSIGVDQQPDNFTDNTRRFRLPEMEQEGWYKEIYDLAPSLCMIMNPEGVIIDCNLAYVKALGYSVKGQVVGRSIFDFAGRESKDTLTKSFDIWRHVGKVHNHEFKMKRADGSIFPALLNATSIHDELGRIIACNADIINVTELVNARKKVDVAMNDLIQKEKELQEANEELKRVERAKEEFISMVSHELKNPLTPIIFFSEILKTQAASGQQFKDRDLATIPIIYQNAKEMKRLIDDILSVYKLDMHLEFSFTEARIVELVDQVVQELSSILDEKGIKLEKKIMCRDGQEMTILCDQLRVRQVLVNLVRNAVDFLPNSGGKIAVILEHQADPQEGASAVTKQGFIRVSIADNGPGVPSDKVSGLFKKFYQADPKAFRKHGGTGLGLTICKEIVETHGGRIWYDSEYKNGACFRFLLPKTPPNASTTKTEFLSNDFGTKLP
jgi:PAS domain S-box-containing protein